MELSSLRAINQGLSLSKSELQDTVNRFIAKSESLEAEIFAINEVQKDVERQKALDNRHFNHKINQLNGIINCLEMQSEEFQTRFYRSFYKIFISRKSFQIILFLSIESQIEVNFV